ncbi:MAG: GNAT family N-acetyltransferase [Saprospiraceae bacterium]|nr:GNAT family N-acetyltransferase [Saprospiraceae bacterium]
MSRLVRFAHAMQNSAIILRRAPLKDLPLVQQIGRATYTPYYAHVWKDTAGMEWYLEHCFGQDALESDLQNPAVEYYLPSNDAGQVLGLLKLVTRQPVPNGSAEQALFLEKIYLLPDFFGQGWGQRLISMVCARARGLGYTAVWLQAMCHAGPVGVYERAGFRKEGLVHFNFEPLREDQREGWLMVKHLPLGFVETPMKPTPYARADIRMSIALTPGIRCRQASEKDLPALVDLARNTFKEAFAHLNDPEDFDPYVVKAFTIEQFSREMSTAGSAFYLLENEGIAVGYFKLNHGRSPLDTDDPVLDFDFAPYADAPVTELERIYLSAFLHGSGLAQQMIADVEQLARMQGSRYLWLGVWDANYKSRRFYEKCGFERIGDHRFLLGGDEQRDILLWKQLGTAQIKTSEPTLPYRPPTPK